MNKAGLVCPAFFCAFSDPKNTPKVFCGRLKELWNEGRSLTIVRYLNFLGVNGALRAPRASVSRATGGTVSGISGKWLSKRAGRFIVFCGLAMAGPRLLYGKIVFAEVVVSFCKE